MCVYCMCVYIYNVYIFIFKILKNLLPKQLRNNLKIMGNKVKDKGNRLEILQFRKTRSSQSFIKK